MIIYDRAIASIMGLLAGDKIGGPTAMALSLCKALNSKKKFDQDEILNQYLLWWRKKGFDTGPVASKVFSLISSGVSAKEASKKVDKDLGGITAGCNPMHRSLPIAIAPFILKENIFSFSQDEAILTHWNPIAGKMAGYHNLICRNLIEGDNWENSLKNSLGTDYDKLVIQEYKKLERGGFSPDVLSASIHFISASENFTESLNKSIRFSGPSNYCPVITGTLAGARWGFSSIPKKLFDHNKLKIELLNEAREILQ